MRFLDEFRNPELAAALQKRIALQCKRPWTIMEICGGQTRTIVQYALDQLLPDKIRILHGPGCPVCVTSVENIDTAIELAMKPDVIIATFGDMMRVPGSSGTLQKTKAQGGDIRVFYSPLDALTLAQANPGKQVVFFGIGFETSAVVTAAALHQAKTKKIDNFSLLCCHVRIPPAIDALLSSNDNTVQGFIAPGHVCTVTGLVEYQTLAERFKTPFVITGFEPVDILQGISMLIECLESGSHDARIQYSRSVSTRGSLHGRMLMETVFDICDKQWRGIGMIRQGGYSIRDEYHDFDASHKFACSTIAQDDAGICRMGDVLRGAIRPVDCRAFGSACTPEHPLGASMVSTEGACAIYYQYRSQQRLFGEE
jgi:hydrogenase expression/formation protein HypD